MKGPLAAWIVGLGGTTLATIACVLLGERIDETITGLLLLLPVIAASAIGAWRIGLPVSLLAGVAYALTFLSPIGRVRIGLTRDVVVIATFVLVALVVGLVAGRAPRDRAAGGDEQLVLRAVSHDLRNPLNTIRAASTDLLSAGVDDPAYRAELLALVASESERLDRIVGNLLSADRVRSGALSPRLEPESLAELLGRSATRLRRVLDRAIRVDVEPGLPDVDVDTVLIDQVVTNLVENAARASDRDQPIGIVARRDGEHAVVTVLDSGPGFPVEQRRELFSVYRSRTGSSGLGLAVCKAVVEAHGGTIEVDDTAPGGAIRFTLAFA